MWNHRHLGTDHHHNGYQRAHDDGTDYHFDEWSDHNDCNFGADHGNQWTNHGHNGDQCNERTDHRYHHDRTSQCDVGPDDFRSGGPGVCGALQVCGHVLTQEDGSGIPNFTVELRNSKGSVIGRTTTTGATGQFIFAAVALGGNYIVSPVVQRGTSSSPVHATIQGLPATGYDVEFRVRGSVTSLTVQNCPPNTYVLITPALYTGAQPPTNVAGSFAYSALAGPDKTAIITVAVQQTTDAPYNLTTWQPGPDGYVRRPTQLAGSVPFGAPVLLNTPVAPLACP